MQMLIRSLLFDLNIKKSIKNHSDLIFVFNIPKYIFWVVRIYFLTKKSPKYNIIFNTFIILFLTMFS